MINPFALYSLLPEIKKDFFEMLLNNGDVFDFRLNVVME